MRKFRLSRNPLVFAGVSTIAAISIAACGGHASGSANVASAEASAKAVASSSPNAAAERQVQAKINGCVAMVPPLKLATSSGRHTVIVCLEGLVPASQRSAFGNDALQLAVKDQIWKRPGRTQFETTDLGNLVLKYSEVTPTPTPTKSGK